MTEFFSALTAIFEVVLVVINTYNEKDAALKKAKIDLMNQWKTAHESNNIDDINAFLQRLR